MLSHPEKHASEPCPCCGGHAPWLLDSFDFNRHVDGTRFSYHKCDACGLLFLANIPDDLGKYYVGGYQAIPKSRAELIAIARPEKFRIDDVMRFKRGGTLLEVGPWIGIFCANAVEAGFKVKAIEINPECVDLLKRFLDVDAMRSDDPAQVLDGLDEEFDVIALWHSIEHVPRPWDVIRAAAKRLAPGGVLVIAAPNPESFEFEQLGARWLHLDAPRHINFLPISLVESLGAEAGLSTLSATTQDRLSKILSRGTWQAYAAYLASKLPRIKYLRGAVRVPLFNLFLMAFGKQQRRLGRGSGYTVVLQRPA